MLVNLRCHQLHGLSEEFYIQKLFGKFFLEVEVGRVSKLENNKKY